jgi:hypothetical protein
MRQSIDYSYDHDYSKRKGSINIHRKTGLQNPMLSVARAEVVEPVPNKRLSSNRESDEIQPSHHLNSKRKKFQHHSRTDSFDYIPHGTSNLQPIQDMSSLQIGITTNVQDNVRRFSNRKQIPDIVQDQHMNASYEVQEKSQNTSSILLPPCMNEFQDKYQSFTSTSYHKSATAEREIQMNLFYDSHHIRNQKKADEKFHDSPPASLLNENPSQSAMLSKQTQLPTTRPEAQTVPPPLTFNEGHNHLNSKHLSQYLLGLSSSNRLLAHSRENTFDWPPSYLSSLSVIGKDLALRALMDQSSHVLSALDIQSALRGTAYTAYLASHLVARQDLLQELLVSQTTSRILSKSTSSLRSTHNTAWSNVLQCLQSGTDTSQGRGVTRHSPNGIASEYNFDSQEHFYRLLHQNQSIREVDGAHAAACRHHGADGRESAKTVSGEYKIPESLPIALSLPDDKNKLSPLQVLLRQQIEIFAASDDDLMTHARGRNKPITLKQVGIRCRHCASLPLKRQKRGAVYFPFTLLEIYQAAQNMASSHFTQDNCSEISSETRLKLLECSLGCKSAVGLGKYYWADLARSQGLFDTDHGIRFIRDQ